MNNERNSGGSAAPASPGWYNDPARPGRLRRWDGGRWTTETLTPPHVRRAQLKRVQLRLALVALLLFGAVAVAILVFRVDRRPQPPPRPADVAAATQCAAFRRFLDSGAANPGPTQPVIPTNPTLAPPYAGLVADIRLAEAAAQRGDSETLQQAGSRAIARCAGLPPAAKAAGGFTR